MLKELVQPAHESVPSLNIPEIVEKSKSGEVDAKNILGSHLIAKLSPLAQRRIPEKADDLVQESLIRIFSNLDNFDPEWGKGSYTQNFYAWSFVIAKNVLIDEIRRQKQETELYDDIEASEPQRAKESEILSKEEFEKKLKEWIMDNLPPGNERTVTYLAAGGLKNKEVTNLTRMPLGSVKVRLHHGRKKTEEGFLFPLGLRRTSSYQEEYSRLSSASLVGYLPAIQVLHLWYTTDDAVIEYLKKHPREQKEVWGDLLPATKYLTSKEYSLLTNKYMELATTKNGRILISPDNLQELRRRHKHARPARFQRPRSDVEPIANLAKTEVEYRRLIDAARDGRIDGIKTGKRWFITKEAADQFLSPPR